MRQTFAWGALIVAVLGWGAWSQLQGLWTRRNELMADRIRAKLIEAAPEWDIRFEQVELLENARVQLTGVRAAPRGSDRPLIELPALIAHLNPQLLSQSLQVQVTHVDLQQPMLHIRRDATGEWNCRNLPPIFSTGAAAPELELHDGAILISLESSDSLPALELTLGQINVQLTNRARRAYALRGDAQLDGSGKLELEGGLNIDTLRWSLSGRCDELSDPDRLIQLAANLSPDARQKLQGMACPTDRRTNTRTSGVPVQSAAHSTSAVSNGQRCCIPALGVSTRLELAFHLSGATPSQPIQYQLAARIRDGMIDNPALPVPLHDLEGELFVDNSQVVVRSFRASNGDSQLFVDGHLRRDNVTPQRRLAIKAENLQFNPVIREQLRGNLLKLYDALQPAGRFNLDVVAQTNDQGAWDWQLNRFDVQDGSVRLEVFPYPTRDVHGRIWQEGERFLVDFAGIAGVRPVTVKGEFRHPGAHVRADLLVAAQQVPVDDTLLAALSTPPLRAAQETLSKLQLNGTGDVQARVVKRGIPGEPVKVALDVRLLEGGLTYEQFPYSITDLQGRLSHNPLAENPSLRHVWQLTEVSGRHGAAQISANGGFAINGGQTLVDLTLQAINTPIDRDLELACLAASPQLRELFDNLGRAGAVDLQDIRILWSPGVEPVVTLPGILIKDAIVRLKYWPFPWERVTGKLAWNRQRLTIFNLDGWYGGETYLKIDSHGEADAAVLEIPETGPLAWHLHLEDVGIRKLIPDSVFRRSLIPTGVANIIETLDPRGPLDLDIGLDVKQAAGPEGLVTAAWHLDAHLQNNTIMPGLELTDVTGAVRIVRGVWDGVRSFVDGYFELESATALDLPLQSISGPLLVDGDDVYVGTPAWPGVRSAPPHDKIANPYAGSEVRMDLYQGKVGCSLQARLSTLDPELTTYRAVVKVNDVPLESWAADHGSTGERLRGPINGQLDFVGQGTNDRALRGQGWVQIMPAQLYELPVLNRVLSSFDLRQPNRTAFNYAFGEFEIHDGYFDFKQIDLVGEALRLVGYGTVAYADGLNEQLNIEFGRSKFRNQIPIIGQVFSAVTTNSIGVRVNGTVSQPIINVQPKLGIVDDTLRKMLDAFNNGQTPQAPRALNRSGGVIRGFDGGR
ncbi:MAG: hypothetical protein ACK5Q5_14960 [Planctomycetaceae bacterium]